MLNLIIHKKVNLDNQKKKYKLFCIFCVAETLTNILYSMCNFNMLMYITWRNLLLYCSQKFF